MLVTAARAAKTIISNLQLPQIKNGVAHVAVVTDKHPSVLADLTLSGYKQVLDSNSTIVPHYLPFRPDSFMDDIQSLQQQISNMDTLDNQHALMGCILIQNGAFQNDLAAYRLRLRLFNLGLRVAEHAHLRHMATSSECETYLLACSLSSDDAQVVAEQVRALLLDVGPETPLLVTDRSLDVLRFEGHLETPLLNTGKYDCGEMNCLSTFRSRPSTPASVGGTFPIGEVITELIDLGRLNGSANVFAFPSQEKKIVLSPTPFRISIREGIVVDIASNAPKEFIDVISLIRQVEGQAMIRELGIGINPFIGKTSPLSDVTAFERQRGVHLSVGKRHPLFIKTKNYGDREPSDWKIAPLRRKDGTFHIDIFLDAQSISVKGRSVSFFDQ